MGYKDLIVWEKSIQLVLEVYKLTDSFPKEENYGLKSQIRRAAVSIPSNIAEGSGRNGKKEFAQFLYIAISSLAEIDTQIFIAKELKYINIEEFTSVEAKIVEIRKMLLSLVHSLK